MEYIVDFTNDKSALVKSDTFEESGDGITFVNTSMGTMGDEEYEERTSVAFFFKRGIRSITTQKVTWFTREEKS